MPGPMSAPNGDKRLTFGGKERTEAAARGNLKTGKTLVGKGLARVQVNRDGVRFLVETKGA